MHHDFFHLRRILVGAFLLCGALTVGAGCPPHGQHRLGDGQEARGLTLADVVSGTFYAGGLRGAAPWSDGESYAQISDDGKRLVRYSFQTGRELSTVLDLDKAKGARLRRIEGYRLSPDGQRLLVQTATQSIYRHSFTAQFYLYDLRTGELTALSQGGAQQSPQFSPDGTMVAFVRGGNLFLVKLLFGAAEMQVTKDGKKNEVINGLPDWVNEEEFSSDCSFVFTQDSKMLCWIRYDESRVPLYRIQTFKGLSPEKRENDEYPGEYAYKYPVAGARNSEVCVKTYDVLSRVERTIDLPPLEGGYIPRLFQTGDPNRLAIVTLNRHQDRMDVYMANPRSCVATLALREQVPGYVDETAYQSMKFEGDRFAFLSDRSGWRHLYVYNLRGELLRQVTSGNFDLTSYYGHDASTDTYYVASHEPSPLRTAVYAVDRAGRRRCLTPELGCSGALFSSDLRHFICTHSSLQQPTQTTLRSSAGGRVLCTLEENKKLSQRAKEMPGCREFFTFRTQDGEQLNGYMVKPRDFDSLRRYPVLLYQYSGPGSQEVRDAWDTGFYGSGGVWESLLAQEGYVSVVVDGRGTGGRGAAFQKCTYLRLGEKEANDQVETALYLGTLPWVDKERIGIWGWSFGGFNTLMAMTDPRGVFKAGVAVAAVSNWKYYDTVYTERFMRTPAENPEGYGISPLARAGQLHGSLLLVHGTADDNVHFRNAAEMSEALVQSGKQFQMQVYTNRNHSIYGGGTREHLFTRILDFLRANL